MKADSKGILDQITDQCIDKMYEKKELQKANIIKYLEKHRHVAGTLSAVGISIVIAFIIVIIQIILMKIPLEILL